MVRQRQIAVMLIAPALLLSACDSAGGSGGPGAVSEGEARALDEAAEMLEERRLPEGALPPTGAEAATPPSESTPEESAPVEETVPE